MSDNPYERDNPYEPDPATADPGAQAASRPEDAPSGEQAGAPAVDAQPAPPADTSPGPADTERFDTAPAADEPAERQLDESGAPTAAEPTDRYSDPADEPAPARVSTAGDPDGAVTSTFDVREAERTRPSGSHQAERPVPRSGLAEHDSAGYLTGDRPLRQDADLPAGTETDAPATGAEGAWLAGGTAGAAGAGPTADEEPASTARPDRDVVLDGTTALTRPPSRTAAHVWAVVVTLLLTPVAWYLLADAGARLTLPPANPWATGNPNMAAVVELVGGLLVLAVVLLAARWSSLGAFITGSLVLVLGVPFVAAPAWTQQVLEPVVDWLDGLGDFGGNVAHHLVATGSTGRFVVYGLALVLVGVVSHGARRLGRREVRPVAETA